MYDQPLYPKLYSSSSCVPVPLKIAKSLQSCPALCDPIDGSPPGSAGPWDSPGKNTGVGCHFLLQCVKVKSESEVAQSCPTPSDPMDCSPSGPSVHGIFQTRVLEWVAVADWGVSNTRGRLKPSRILWAPPRYKSPFVSPISCLYKRKALIS